MLLCKLECVLSDKPKLSYALLFYSIVYSSLGMVLIYMMYK